MQNHIIIVHAPTAADAADVAYSEVSEYEGTEASGYDYILCVLGAGGLKYDADGDTLQSPVPHPDCESLDFVNFRAIEVNVQAKLADPLRGFLDDAKEVYRTYGTPSHRRDHVRFKDDEAVLARITECVEQLWERLSQPANTGDWTCSADTYFGGAFKQFGVTQYDSGDEDDEDLPMWAVLVNSAELGDTWA